VNSDGEKQSDISNQDFRTYSALNVAVLWKNISVQQ